MRATMPSRAATCIRSRGGGRAFAKAYVWWVKEPLDVARMREAARRVRRHARLPLVRGRRRTASDEAPPSTRGAGRPRSTSSRTATCCSSAIQGSHFLWKMVRRMVGVLVEVGRGALPPDAIRDDARRGIDGAGAADGAAVGTVSRAGVLQGRRRTAARRDAVVTDRRTRRRPAPSAAAPSTRRTTSS